MKINFKKLPVLTLIHFKFFKFRLTKSRFIREPKNLECRLAKILMYVFYVIVNINGLNLFGFVLSQGASFQMERKTGMPLVVGAVDGKHIEIKCTLNSGTVYYYYKM